MGSKDPRDFNMFFTRRIEMPNFCKKKLALEELIKLS